MGPDLRCPHLRPYADWMGDDESKKLRRHPIFSRIVDAENQMPAGAVDAMTERKVRQAREDGYFDNLAGAGKPIPDIDQQRRSGWWADRFVAEERQKLKALRAEEEARQAMPALWRLPTEAEVIDRVAELNATLDAANQLDPESTVGTWHRLRR